MASSKLGKRASDLISDPENQLYMSAVSWWELGLKRALGKLDADLTGARRDFERRGVVAVAVTLEHGEAAAALPVLHRDPFDHMLVAQALSEGLRLLTRDKFLERYGPTVMCV